jgi:hypothetical protein
VQNREKSLFDAVVYESELCGKLGDGVRKAA